MKIAQVEAEEYEISRALRESSLAEERRITGAALARRANKSSSAVNAALRGDYPHKGACWLPKYVRVALESYQIDTPTGCVTW